MTFLIRIFTGMALAFIIPFPHASDAEGNRAHNTFVRFSFDDSDPRGPSHWDKLPDGEDTRNFCGLVDGRDNIYMNPGTPLNILTSEATLPIRDIEQEVQLDINKPSLIFRVRTGLEKLDWWIGYPTDTYTGIELRGSRLGLMQVLDLYDPVGAAVAYDFHFAFISFCNLQEVPKERSSHQLDGKKYPFEVHMLFFSEPQDIGMDNNLYPKNNVTKMIMISVLGEFRDEDNPRLQPLIEAVKKYNFGDFDMDDTDDEFSVKIQPPFSPSWLLPKKSQYFYYRDGTFPVPPCFPIAQVYVFKDQIKISKAQLKVLTNIISERESSKKFTCTFGTLRYNIPSTQVFYNPYPHTLLGVDGRLEDLSNVGGSFHVAARLLIFKSVTFVQLLLSCSY